jgi:hypothetical protein
MPDVHLKKGNTMEARELYKEKAEAQMHEWGAKLEVLKAKVEKLTAQAKIDMHPRVEAIHAKFDAAKAKLDAIGPATDEKWDEVAKDMDHAWSDFKAAVEGTFDAMKSHT